MSKYIDAEKLKTEIERRKKFHDDAMKACVGLTNIALTHSAGWEEDNKLLTFIDSLQQEQPEQKKKCNDCPHCVDRKDQYGWHFKGCFGGPYKGKFIAEIEECPLRKEQQKCLADTSKTLDGLMEEIKRYYSENYAYITSDNPTLSILTNIARHFYGLRNRALEEAARHVYESWMGGAMADVRRDMVTLGKVINARKEE